MVSVQVVESAGHFAKTCVRVDHDNLRAGKCRIFFQRPGEIFWVDTHNNAGCIKLAALSLGEEIAGIYEIHGIYLALLLCGIRRHQCKKRMLLMA